MDMAMIPGDEGNFKNTTRSDLERFREIAKNEKTAESKAKTAER